MAVARPGYGLSRYIFIVTTRYSSCWPARRGTWTVAQLPRHEAYVQQYPVLRHSDTANLMAPFGDPPLLRVVGQHATLQV